MIDENTRKIYEAFLKLDAATGDRKKELKGVHQVALDIKDQGLSLGYDLMTAICTELCLLIENMGKAGPKEVEVIKIYIAAMKLVIKNNIQGTGGDIGEKMLSGLRQVCDKFNT